MTLQEMLETPIGPEPTDNAQAGERTPFWSSAMALTLEKRKLGIRRKVKTQTVQTKGLQEGQQDADPDMLHVTKDIIDSKELAEIGSLDGEIVRFIGSRSVPAPLFRTGIYLIPKTLLAETDEAIRKYVVEREALVDKFMSAYDKAKETAKTKLGPQFDPTDYPDAATVRATFGVSFQYLEFGAPQGLADLSPELYERERAKAEAQWTAALEEGRKLLYTELEELTGKLLERLTPGENGERKTFRDTLVSNVTDWLQTAEQRNLLNDGRLSEIADKVRAALQGKTADSLRNRWTAESTRVAFEAIKAEIDAAKVAPAPTRQYGE